MLLTRRKYLRIALFSDYFSDENLYGGGVGTVVVNLARELCRRGHAVYVFTTSPDHTKMIRCERNLQIFQYASIMRAWQTFISLSLLINPLKHDVDVVHIEGGLVASLSALLYSLIKRRPLIITVHHTGDVWKDPIKNLIVRLYEHSVFQVILRKARKIIVPSRFLLSQSKHLSKFEEKIVEIPNGINETVALALSKKEARKILGLPTDTKIILFVGALCRRKGVHVLISAAKEVVRKFTKCLFILVGCETEETPDLKELIRNKGLDEYIKLAGYVSEFRKKLYYRAADLFVLPSLSEGFGIVILEAAANGLPLVVSNLAVFKATVKNGFNGLISKKNDAKDLANKLLFLLENDHIREVLGRNALATVTEFSWKRVAEETLRVYEG